MNATKWNQDVVANSEFLARKPLVVLTRSTEQSIPTGAQRSISWNTEVRDNNGMWSSTAPTRIDIATAGVYRIEATCTFAASTLAGTATLRQIGIYTGAAGSTTVVPNLQTNSVVVDSSGADISVFVSGYAVLTSTDFVRIQVVQNSGAAINIVNSTVFIPRVAVVWESS